MAWVRLHDGAMSHPKLVELVDWKNPFCLWMWGLSYCQMHLTDGRIPAAAMPNPVAGKTAARLVTENLWEVVSGGYQVHDYLDWNDSKETVTKKRAEAKERMASARNRGRQNASNVAPVRANFSQEQTPNFSPELPEKFYGGLVRVKSSSSEREFEGKQPVELTREPFRDPSDDDLTTRAGELVQNYYDWFVQERRGARLKQQPHLDFQEAYKLVSTWPDDRLKKLAKIILTTDDEWISATGRGFKVFSSKASWADDRLTQWEHEQASKAVAQ